jgi:hypothetical protein
MATAIRIAHKQIQKPAKTAVITAAVTIVITITHLQIIPFFF